MNIPSGQFEPGDDSLHRMADDGCPHHHEPTSQELAAATGSLPTPDFVLKASRAHFEPSDAVLDELAEMGEFGGFAEPADVEHPADAPAPRCPQTPTGWQRCTRRMGHDGPCAHWPEIPPRDPD